jgi:hypothetical protein
MRFESEIIQRVKAAQETVFRVACRDHGLTLKAISLDAGVPYDSICNYAKGETQMPVAVLYALCGVIPDELLSLLLPEGRCVVQVPAQVDHDEIADAFADYLHTKNQAHHPDSPAGRDIADCEREQLDAKVVHLPICGKVNAA